MTLTTEGTETTEFLGFLSGADFRSLGDFGSLHRSGLSGESFVIPPLRFNLEIE